jgi:hypothetical protein
MVVLDIAAPILMMYGLKTCSASNTSLLNNFEIVATALIALFFFGESVKRKLWIAIMLVTIASILLSLEDGNMSEALSFSQGSLLVLGATICWGLENNCTRQIADRDPMEIVTVKGFGSGLGALMIAVCVGSEFPTFQHIAIILLLGNGAYGLSIYFYTYAQRTIADSWEMLPAGVKYSRILLNMEPVTVIYKDSFMTEITVCSLLRERDTEKIGNADHYQNTVRYKSENKGIWRENITVPLELVTIDFNAAVAANVLKGNP